ncbi:MAG TPA: hypothetical protein VGI12_01690 [Vicinamibacterales bacterium]|jgi:hypothetical protein
METKFSQKTQRTLGSRWSLFVAAAAIVLTPVGFAAQQIIDLCGCANTPGLQPFDAGTPSTYPAGTSGCAANCSGGTITLQVPPDGILRFTSFTVNGGFNLNFARNAANSPVTILVAGDVLLRGANGCCQTFIVSGSSGSSGSGSGIAGVGGLGGPGGFRGGDAAAESINGFTTGGTGFGPGGGAGASTSAVAGGGTFFGAPELTPLLGASGGGGGTGFSGATNCTGGGGGGGGGGLLIVANGTLTVQNLQVFADGGGGGSVGNGSCTHGGGGGSGGAIRIVARSFVDAGNGQFYARGGGGGFDSPAGTDGRIRLEATDTTAGTMFLTQPSAARVTGPTPLGAVITPSVRITGVGGQPPPTIPQGTFGSIDLLLPSPGLTGIDVATSGVPSGTGVLVTVKPRLGGNPLTVTIPLNNCSAAGECLGTASFTLAAGAYVVEARATFEVQ